MTTEGGGHRCGKGDLSIARTWSGSSIPASEQVSLELELTPREFLLSFDAPHHDDPLPDAPVGRTDGLWEYEVVELFLLGSGGQYIELEFGPGGHHLGLRLTGPRRVVPQPPAVRYRSVLRGGRWCGDARVSVSDLPEGLCRCNAYAIHGLGAERRYLAAAPAGGSAPDFHRLDGFSPLPWLP